jgi:hypothetical protein
MPARCPATEACPLFLGESGPQFFIQKMGRTERPMEGQEFIRGSERMNRPLGTQLSGTWVLPTSVDSYPSAPAQNL